MPVDLDQQGADVASRVRWERAKLLLSVAWAIAIVPNVVEAFTDVDGAWWSALRYGLSTLFLLVAIYCVVLWLQRPRRGRASGTAR
jgi:hypothetical protein